MSKYDSTIKGFVSLVVLVWWIWAYKSRVGDRDLMAISVALIAVLLESATTNIIANIKGM